MKPVELVISGFQTGADIAGIHVARSFGIPTSGWMPKGFRTLAGLKPEYRELYGAKEHDSSGYKERTRANVEWACGTIRLATHFQSAGEKCTLNAIKYYGKPYFDVEFDSWSGKLKNFKEPPCRMQFLAAKWILDNNIKVLNIAGNSEKTSTYIGGSTNVFLTEVFRMLGYKNGSQKVEA